MTDDEQKLAYIDKQLALDPPREPEDIKMLMETRKRLRDSIKRKTKAKDISK
jgi:hypothetical protein